MGAQRAHGACHDAEHDAGHDSWCVAGHDTWRGCWAGTSTAQGVPQLQGPARLVLTLLSAIRCPAAPLLQSEGAIFLLSCPVMLPAKERRSFALSVSASAQLTKLGTCPAFGVCKALRKDGQRCTMVREGRTGADLLPATMLQAA